MKKNKRELRNQIRKEDRTDKQNFFNNLMDKPDSKTFYRLIRRNKHESKDTKSTLIKDENNGEVINPEEQSQIFADYYEKLAVPSNEEHYDEELLEENKYRLALMNNIIKHTIQESIITTFNEEEILKSIAKLNSRKTSDEYSLTAEHFKYAGRSIIPNILSLFNNIMQTGEIPKVFKTGIMTPLHKKRQRLHITNLL
ncbi:unnamed protein product [Mytilus coruscus]|uniref:Reverse transcriptase domain-containing protein n=1 Tax=Mytilus coruscus TaxID=42192 RepID=A0A6J8A1Y3_MYTCO|nr:unnamed protein product [Mytilus coruscus]